MRAFAQFGGLLKSRNWFVAMVGPIVWLAPSVGLAQTEIKMDSAIDAIQRVGLEGRGNDAASKAWNRLVSKGPEAMLPILRAMGSGNALADNWFRSAIDALDAEADAMDLKGLMAFLIDGSQPPVGREIAFSLIQRRRADVAERLIPGFLQDSSLALRRLAVDGLLRDAEGARAQAQDLAAIALFRQALSAARDVDQIDAATNGLEDLGESVDLAAFFGFLTEWDVIGPFDNAERAGFERVFPPEVDGRTEDSYVGKGQQDAGWVAYTTDDRYGMVDINEPLGALKETVAYSHTVYHAARSRPAEIRIGCKNAWKVWLNGEYLFGRDEYHRGIEIDQYRLPVALREGPNEILVKVCQNEQLETWTVEWEFQLRVCDAMGAAIQEANHEE